MVDRRERLSVRVWWAIAAAVAIGLALRILAARDGALWTDEAWSAIHAVEVGTPIGVFLLINHDNNHHLMSLWLQSVGLQASPLLARAPAVAAGTLTIVVAALIGARRSPGAAVIAAILFAVAPILVTYGSEARGYALMLLAAMIMLLLLDRWLDRPDSPPPTLSLAILALLGMLSHLTMAAFIGLFTLWTIAVLSTQRGLRMACHDALKLMGPATVVSGLVIVGVWAAADANAGGMQVGNFSPFSLDRYALAIGDLTATTVGASIKPWWPLPVLIGLLAALVAIRPPRWIGQLRFLLPLLILSVPLGVLVLRPGNPEFARYYLSSAIGVLLFASVWIGRELRGPAIRSALAIGVVMLMVGTSLYGDLELIQLRRGDPDRPLQIMEARSNHEPTVAFAEERLKGVLIAASERRRSPFRIAKGCAPADYLLGARWSLIPAHPEVTWCGKTWHMVDYGNSGRLSGEGWALYRSQRLQSIGVAGSGPPPAHKSRKRHERA